MKIKKKIIILTVIIIGTSLISTQALSDQSQRLVNSDQQGSWEITISINNNEQNTYEGRLRLFLIEPVSSIDNYNGDPFHFSVKDILINEEITVESTKDISLILTEDDIDMIQEDNTLLLTAIYNKEGHDQYAVPPEGNQFEAHDVDAVAAAYPNSVGTNEKRDGFSHTVLVEEVATTSCRYCPTMGETLYNIYQSDDYPFYFITLVSGTNQNVNRRISNDFNVYSVPVAFFDGGYSVFLGGSQNQYDYRNLIEEAGQRNVHDLDLSLSVYWNPDLIFPPNVKIDRPENGIYFLNQYQREFDKPLIIGSFTIEASADDNESGIERVDFYINDELRSSDSSAPFKMTNWKENKIFGQYTIRVVAYDEYGYQDADEVDVIRFF